MFASSYDLQKDYWEGVDKRRSPDHPAVRAFARAKLDLVLAALPPLPAGTTMLEVGAGNGYFSITFQSAFELSCADFSANVLRINPLSNHRKIVADAQRLPFRDGSFEVAFCGNLLHHLETPATAVQEMARVAARHVVLVEPNALNPLMFLFGVLVK
jgi:ubiquinone/menaquinone biosynthesis C-methylase UbiE